MFCILTIDSTIPTKSRIDLDVFRLHKISAMKTSESQLKATTRESYGKRIDRVLEYLAAHLDEPLDIHRLAEEAFLSPYHFHRVYVAMIGETLAETLRRRRLHMAAVSLITSERPIASIAAASTYAHVQAFTRAFRESYGVTPAQYRQHGKLSAALHHASQPLTKEPIMFSLKDVHIKSVPEANVVALQHHGDYQTIGHSFEKVSAWAAGKAFLRGDSRSWGIYYDDPMSKPKSELVSEACMEAPEGTQGDGNIRAFKTPGGKCAVFEFTGPYSDLEKPYRWLYETWLPQSGEEPRDAPPFEEYLNDARTTPPSQLRTAICIPLK
jgi:AraC family transcriptional regulator